jgi:DMSO/TMAO reductase YedYZ molybdopterin-dependent catalytic subunit
MNFRSEDYLTRRHFLQGASALSLSLLLGEHFPARPSEPMRLQRIERSATPLNLETPRAALDQPLTPNELFYVRNHFPVPTLPANAWRLRVVGAVERELELTLEDIRRMTSRTVTMTLECAGNTRSALNPAVRGTPWANGAVSTTEWTGVSLIDVLNRAGPRQGAVDVVLEGADRGEIASEPRSPGVIHFARSLPIAKARQQSVLLAYRMRNADLPANHGFPVRAIVPGWFGMASVKWLTRITVTDRPYNGFFQSLDYSIFERRQGLVTVTPVTEMQVKSVIVSPAPMQRIAPNTPHRIHGAAWSGEANITRVVLSADSGRTWTAARLLGEERNHSWRMWEFPWRTPAQAGRVMLMVRATDARDNTQPMERDTDRRNYMINHVLPVEVDVR